MMLSGDHGNPEPPGRVEKRLRYRINAASLIETGV